MILEEKDLEDIEKGLRPEAVVFENSESKDKEFDDSQTSIKSFISTEDMDRSGDIMTIKGIDISHYKDNPIVLYNHDRNTVIAKNERLTRTTNDKGVKVLQAVTKFAPTQFAQELYEMAKLGFIKGWSISFIPKEWETRSDEKSTGWNIFKSLLLEYSLVTIPDNQNALTQKALIKALRDFSEPTQKKILNNVDINLANEIADFQNKIDEYKAQLKSLTMTVVNFEAVRQMEKEVANGYAPNLDKIINQIKKELF